MDSSKSVPWHVETDYHQESKTMLNYDHDQAHKGSIEWELEPVRNRNGKDKANRK